MQSFVSTWVFALTGVVALGAAGCTTTTDAQSASPSAPSAQDSAASETQLADAKNDVESKGADEKVCKRTKSTGSNFSRRKCQTVAEWEAESKAARDALDRLDRKNREGCTAAQKASGC